MKAKNKVLVIKWSSQRPDLNPIENMWALFEDKTPTQKIHYKKISHSRRVT